MEGIEEIVKNVSLKDVALEKLLLMPDYGNMRSIDVSFTDNEDKYRINIQTTMTTGIIRAKFGKIYGTLEEPDYYNGLKKFESAARIVAACFGGYFFETVGKDLGQYIGNLSFRHSATLFGVATWARNLKSRADNVKVDVHYKHLKKAEYDKFSALNKR